MRKIKMISMMLSAALILQFSVPAFAAQPEADVSTSSVVQEAAEEENSFWDTTCTLTLHANNMHPVSYEAKDKYGLYTWTSSDTSVVTVDSSGIVRAQGLGKATVTGTSKSDPDKTRRYIFTVENATLKLNYSETSLYINYDEPNPTKQLRVDDSFATLRYTDWSSNDPSVVSVDSNGLVTAHKEGTARIIASTNEGTCVCDITVTSGIGALFFSADRSKEYGSTYRTMAEAERLGDIKTGDVINLSEYLKKDERVQIQNWSSDNTEVATVTDSGWVTAVGEGTATITVTSTEGKSAKCYLVIGQAAQEEYREGVRRAEKFDNVMGVVALGAVVVFIVIAVASNS